MRNFWLLGCFLLFSCASEEEISKPSHPSLLKSEDTKEIKHSPDQVSICHNPSSKEHKQECTDQCFEPNLGNYSFCWTLFASDCRYPLVYDWQKQNCHFFD